MSLNYDFSQCVGREGWSERDYNTLDKLIWGTMTVGLHGITEDNLSEWLLRMRMERANFSEAFQMKYQHEKGYYIRLVHLRKFVGLRTNASDLTRSKWLKELMERIVRCEEGSFAYELQKLAKEQTEVSEVSNG